MAGELTVLTNNNPGAIRKPGSLEFQSFASADEGIRAQEDLLRRRYFGKGLKSVADIIETYSPRKSRGGDNTDEQVNNYINYVAQRLGVNPRDSLSPAIIPRLAGHMREFETGRGKKSVPAPTSGFVADIAQGLNVPLKEYTIEAPTQGEQNQPSTMTVFQPNQLNGPAIGAEAIRASDAAGRYAAYLEQAIEPLRANSAAVVDKTRSVAQTKENLYNDFASRERDLEAKIRPLQEKRQAILDRLTELDGMSPLERRLKSAFNSDYDPRVLRGRLGRIQAQLEGHEATYKELNELRSGVAALAVDAEAADVDVLNAQSRSVLADAQLLGQVAGAIRTNADTKLLPLQMQTEVLRLNETAKQSKLGSMTLEMANKLYQDAQASPNGTVVLDGVTLTVGDLQDVTRRLSSQDLSLRSMKSAYAVQDIQLANQLEDTVIEHMSPEQIQQALKDGGKFNGQQLSVMKLAQAANATNTLREQQVDSVVRGQAVGQAGTMLENFNNFLHSANQKATEMFGNLPGELNQITNQLGQNMISWRKGYREAQAQGIGDEYIARTMPTLIEYQKAYDNAVSQVARKWGGGKAELTAVADAYLRGNPLNGDAAVKGLITIARSGMPAGAKLDGPSMQALQTARAIVREWDSGVTGKSGDSLAALMQGGSKKESDLLRRVQDQVSAVYADALTDQLMTALPDIARTARDPRNPGKIHPFAAVSKDDFITAVRHGDAEGFAKVGKDIGLNPQETQRMFSEGIDGQTWQNVKKAHGWADGKFADLFASLQSVQMASTLTALDASGSRRPGFSPAKAYVDFLQSQEVQNKIDSVVNSYGRSSFGAFITQSAAGGGYRDSWAGYSNTMAAVYTQLHSTDLRNRIKQQRSLTGDPFVRMNAVLRASELNPQEATALINAVKPLVRLQGLSATEQTYASAGRMIGVTLPGSATNESNFDSISNIIRTHKFDDPQIEAIRKRAARNWDAMDAVLGRISESFNEY